MGSSLSEERTTLFTGEKNDTSNQKPQRCVSFAPKFLPFIGACSLQRPRLKSCFADIQREKFFPQTIEKHLGNWSGIVSCVSLTMKKIVEIRQNLRGRGKTELAESLSCAFYRSYFVFYLNLYSNQPFSIVYSEQKVNITALVTLKLQITSLHF